MSNSDTPCRYLVCYDIADPKRLTRVHRFVSKHAAPLQYSVFMAEMNASALDLLLACVAGLIKQVEDDVRIYPLPDSIQFATLGRSSLPDGVIAVGRGAWNAALNGELPLRDDSESLAKPEFLSTRPATS